MSMLLMHLFVQPTSTTWQTYNKSMLLMHLFVQPLNYLANIYKSMLLMHLFVQPTKSIANSSTYEYAVQQFN
jgi:hypothetical protein